MNAAAIAAVLGGAYQSGKWWRCRCPLHRSRGATLALRHGRHGLIIKCWGGCDPSEVRAELRARGLLENSPAAQIEFDPEAEEQRRQDDAARRISRATEIWVSSLSAEGTVVDTYLHGRAIALPAPFPLSLRFLPAGHSYARHPNSNISCPVMLGAVVDRDGMFTGVHRTWLAADGSGKAPVQPDRMTLGRVSGGAIRLGMLDPCPDQTLVVAEGVESALAGSLLLRNPAWAALSATGIEHLILPDAVRSIQIAVDRDANGCGEAAARCAALRWIAEGRRVQLIIPDCIGADLNDLLREA
jgi:hypothetical protein